MTVSKFATALIATVCVAEASFRSGSVSTYEKFTYGKFITRMKAPDKMGTVASFFTYWDGPDFTPTEWNELDIEIVPSVVHNPFSMNIIYGDGVDKKESHQYAAGFNPHDDWHTYAMEWTPEYISWSIDGHEVRHVPTTDPAVEHMVKEQSLRMNFWTPTFHSWGKGLDAHDMPWYVLYDYVEVWLWNSDSNEFELHWKDDFDKFDSKRWHKASGGFDANSSVFHPENVSVKAGNLVLKMEPEPAEAVELLHDTVVVDQHPLAVEEYLAEGGHHTRRVIDHDVPRHSLHKSEHWNRDHVRSHKHAHSQVHDERFWIGNHEGSERNTEQEADDIPYEDYEDSDSDADWREYQDYLHGRRARHHIIRDAPVRHSASRHMDAPGVVETEVIETPRHRTYHERIDSDDSDRYDEYEDKEAYKAWKRERKHALKEEKYLAHRDKHHYYDEPAFYADEGAQFDSYMDYKQAKYEDKEAHRRAKEHRKEQKHWDKEYYHRGRRHHYRDYGDYDTEYSRYAESEDYYRDERPRHYARAHEREVITETPVIHRTVTETPIIHDTVVKPVVKETIVKPVVHETTIEKPVTTTTHEVVNDRIVVPVTHTREVVHVPVHRYSTYRDDYDMDHSEYHSTYHRYHRSLDDYRRFRYEEALPAKIREVEEKQRDADEHFETFRREHPYMSDEELNLHHKHYEVEPFFHSVAERDEWKWQKKQEKLRREERRRVLKHEREIREMEKAYDEIMDPTYDGDSDVDHVIEENRRHYYVDEHHPHTIEGHYPVHRAVTHVTVPVVEQTTTTVYEKPVHTTTHYVTEVPVKEDPAYVALSERHEVPVYETRHQPEVTTHELVHPPIETKVVEDIPVHHERVYRHEAPVYVAPSHHARTVVHEPVVTHHGAPVIHQPVIAHHAGSHHEVVPAHRRVVAPVHH